VYASKDTHLTLQFARFIESHLKKQPALWELYEKIENPLCDVVVDMEQTGFRIDMDFASVYGEELRLEIAELEIKLRKHFGDINVASPVQLAKVLYEDLMLPDVSGKKSTDAKTLKKLRSKHQGIEDLLSYRDKSKLLSTYVEALPNKVKKDGHIHGSFNQVSTVTGRFSSNDPNLQNLPARARKLIIAPEGKLIVGIDYSQIEPRVLSHLSGDEAMINAYVTGRDLYVEMAMKVFKLEERYCLDGASDPTGKFKPRKAIKSILLGIMYGLGIPSLAEQIGISIEEATQIRLDFFEAFPKVKDFIRATWQEVKENEYVTMMFGRKRRFPNHRNEAIKYDKIAGEILHILHSETTFMGDEVPSNFWKIDAIPYRLKRAFQDVKGSVERVRRMAVNAKIQGSAAIILKISMNALQEYCLPKGWTVNATVHDENLILVDENITLQEVEELEQIMMDAISMKVPTKVDTEVFKCWGDGISKKDYFQLAS
jgi:DNA polymerase I